MLSIYGNNLGEITKGLFFGEATRKKSQKTLINMTSHVKTLQMTCHHFYSQWCHNRASPNRFLWINQEEKTQFHYYSALNIALLKKKSWLTILSERNNPYQLYQSNEKILTLKTCAKQSLFHPNHLFWHLIYALLYQLLLTWCSSLLFPYQWWLWVCLIFTFTSTYTHWEKLLLHDDWINH